MISMGINKGKGKILKMYENSINENGKSFIAFLFYPEEEYFRNRLEKTVIGTYEIGGDVERFLLNDIPSRKECNNRYLHYLKTREIPPPYNDDVNKRKEFRYRVISMLYRFKWSLRQPPKQVSIKQPYIYMYLQYIKSIIHFHNTYLQDWASKCGHRRFQYLSFDRIQIQQTP